MNPNHSAPVQSAIRRQSVIIALALIGTLAASTSVQAQTYSVLYSFAGGSDGIDPAAGLVLDASGNLYGTTTQGGAKGYGTIFKVSAGGKETLLYSFTDNAGDGAYPYAPLVRDSMGNLYGTTLSGGAHDYGTVFQLSAAGTMKIIYSFTGTNGDGGFPYAGLVRDTKGNLYGTTYQQGAYGYGTVFKLDVTGKETVLYSFTGTAGDGANPIAGLVRDSSGNLYGTTYYGGLNSCNVGCGMAFKLSPAGKETVLHTFTGTKGDGMNPSGGLLQDKKGNLYGTTRFSSNGGMVFKLSATGTETVLYTFTGGTDGNEPFNESLILDPLGNLYGTTLLGGDITCVAAWDGCGTVFQINTAEVESVLHSFTGTSGDGANPMAGLVRDAVGNLYGTTAYGGANGDGTVFKITP